MTDTILAVDLGKFNSVLCWYDPATRAASFRTAKTTPAELDRELIRRPAARVVFEACSQAGWVHDRCEALGLTPLVASTTGAVWPWSRVKRKTDRDDALWNFESMWGTTDELWLDEYEHGGLPWEKPGEYREFSPHTKAGNLSKHKAPFLVVHNDLDFRCPIGQGHELFSALQRQGVPCRFVNFPDEGHWVLKPQNSQRWHEEVFGWPKEHVPPGGKQ